ncbi:hypothetical protein [Limibacillus halophilus]|uniref:Uncharacterized protein n=1 Tax=Limibacillus halophilus TaxID=1579333 RepID=A0A839SVL1_9PROT|nr:hypothetical protein [Limibacillus halophilus]MBB3066338.1 hypothetical protein [Limibacillus halophilus]
MDMKPHEARKITGVSMVLRRATDIGNTLRPVNDEGHYTLPLKRLKAGLAAGECSLHSVGSQIKHRMPYGLFG